MDDTDGKYSSKVCFHYKKSSYNFETEYLTEFYCMPSMNQHIKQEQT